MDITIAKPISKLNSWKIDDPTEINLPEDSLFEVSIPTVGEGKFSSRNVSYKDLSVSFASDLSATLGHDYGILDEDDNPISLNELKDEIKKIEKDNLTIDGTKTFNDIPQINANLDDYEIDPENTSAIPNIAYINSVLGYEGSGIDSNSKNKADEDVPSRAEENNHYLKYSDYYDENGNINNHNFLLFNLKTGQKDSSKFTLSSTQVGPAKCYASGNLVCYGWITNLYKIAPQEAWIGLFGKLNNNWVILQIQPIFMTHPNSFQYVGFNLQVKKDLELKIMTGFPVGDGPGGLIAGDHLMYNQWIPNSFFGYILA